MASKWTPLRLMQTSYSSYSFSSHSPARSASSFSVSSLAVFLLHSQVSFCQYFGSFFIFISLFLFVPIMLPVFRAPNKLFQPRLLYSLITPSILVHGCHSCTHIRAVSPTVLLSSPLSLSSSSSLIPFFHSSQLSSLCLPLPPPPLPLRRPSFSFIQCSASRHLHALKERDIFRL